ncbi:hypothetical protein ROZALSC1DRAFT_24822, partial [Rozella allomycis CSF55]
IINADLRPRDSLRVSLVRKRVDSGVNPFAASNEGEKENNTRNNVSEPEELVTTPKKTVRRERGRLETPELLSGRKKEPWLSPILQSPWMKNTSLKLEETVGDQETATLWWTFKF